MDLTVPAKAPCYPRARLVTAMATSLILVVLLGWFIYTLVSNSTFTSGHAGLKLSTNGGGGGGGGQ